MYEVWVTYHRTLWTEPQHRVNCPGLLAAEQTFEYYCQAEGYSPRVKDIRLVYNNKTLRLFKNGKVEQLG